MSFAVHSPPSQKRSSPLIYPEKKKCNTSTARQPSPAKTEHDSYGTSGVIDEETSNTESGPNSMVFDNVPPSTSIVCCTGPDGSPSKPFSIRKIISRSVVHFKIHSALKLSLETGPAFGLTEAFGWVGITGASTV